MIKVGLTGGIGSGKTTVALVFEELGIPVFYADTEAKKFLFHEPVKENIRTVFGESVFYEGEIQKSVLAQIVFNNAEGLQKLNNIIHPLLRQGFNHWCQLHSDAKIVIIEAAILFENGFNDLVDKIIVVAAPLEERISRAQNRDRSTRAQIEARINNQWPEEKLKTLADFVVDNSHNHLILPQLLEIYQQLNSVKY